MRASLFCWRFQGFFKVATLCFEEWHHGWDCHSFEFNRMGIAMRLTGRFKSASLTVAAAIAVVLATSTVAGAETTSITDPLLASRSFTASATMSSQDIYVYAYDSSGVKRGSGEFFAYGEYLYACDMYADGRTVTAHLTWGLESSAKVSDPNGATGDCGYKNLGIAENTTVRLRTCVDGLGCTDWYSGRA